ncbi:hypothetical protein [Arcobacter roscoffensis]|uniref:Uncharacterized protein n=1 Tax=Arcobacter roscoffensis TaxID=2961520 RepID=A0ABY5EAZ3_9BACT|nr:hypothetical protein [Arcobacter roscoffensis]UTJ07883.1 hypothetical protein NJU99_07235 [Arcobacter roscoffensis]
MYIEELYELTIWFTDEVIEKKVLDKYSQLLNKLKQNLQNNSIAYDLERTNLFNSLKEIDTSLLNDEQKKFLDRINVFNKLSSLGVKEIENILFKNSLDIKTATSKLNELITELNKGSQKIRNIKTGLDGIVEVEDKIKDKTIIRLIFDNEASINNVTNLKNWSNEWYEISRGIAMMHDEAPESIEVIGAKKGSIIIELATVALITGTISKIIYEILKVIEKVYDIRKKAEEIKALKLNNQQIEKDLENEASHVEEVAIEDIVDLIIKKTEKSDGDKKNALRKSITNLFKFMNKGGKIEFSLPQKIDNNESEKIIVIVKQR